VVDERESELVRLARAGCKQAFADLLGPLLPLARRLAYGMVLNWTAAEDLASEAAAEAWLRMEILEDGSSFRTSFLRILINICRQARRKEARRARWWALKQHLVDWTHPSGAQTDGGWPEGLELRAALGRLPQREREAIVLRFYLDLPYSEVARLMRIRVDSAKKCVDRGLNQLRRSLAGWKEVSV
jgi:RNA polymerase sigma-70 factor, ECF subfamily